MNIVNTYYHYRGFWWSRSRVYYYGFDAVTAITSDMSFTGRMNIHNQFHNSY